MKTKTSVVIGIVFSAIMCAASLYRWSVTGNDALEFAWLTSFVGWFASFSVGMSKLKKD